MAIERIEPELAVALLISLDAAIGSTRELAENPGVLLARLLFRKAEVLRAISRNDDAELIEAEAMSLFITPGTWDVGLAKLLEEK